jgi:hypothetical protein
MRRLASIDSRPDQGIRLGIGGATRRTRRWRVPLPIA